MTSGLVSRSAVESEPQEVSLSVVLPCRDEEASVAACVRSVYESLADFEGLFEVLVVDNGSSDSSRERAIEAGARVVYEARPGYGNACRAGIGAAVGDVIVLADADGTYDLGLIPKLVDMVNSGHDLVIGSRLRGDMETGAMPWLHRAGTPVLTGLVNVLFRTELTDVNCGIRAMSADGVRSLGLSASGMEFASEMVVEAASQGLKIAEIPVGYLRRQGGEPKLRTWRDGYRHLRLVVGTWLQRDSAETTTGVTPFTRPRDMPAFEPGEPPS